jgi:hypothetical protein
MNSIQAFFTVMHDTVKASKNILLTELSRDGDAWLRLDHQ